MYNTVKDPHHDRTPDLLLLPREKSWSPSLQERDGQDRSLDPVLFWEETFFYSPNVFVTLGESSILDDSVVHSYPPRRLFLLL